MKLSFFYLLCACICLASGTGFDIGSLLSGLACKALFAAVKQNPYWTVDYDQRVVRWNRPSTGSITLPSCRCDSTPGGSGNVSRIYFKDQGSGSVISNLLCRSCPGQEVTDPNFKMAADKLSKIFGSSPFRLCPGLNIFRCACPASTSIPAVTGPTGPTGSNQNGATPVNPTITTTAVTPSTTGEDPYN